MPDSTTLTPVLSSPSRTASTSSRPPRARRRAAGVVAQYIHELSERHAEDARSLATAPTALSQPRLASCAA
jgi:hypothetical protein